MPYLGPLSLGEIISRDVDAPVFAAGIIHHGLIALIVLFAVSVKLVHRFCVRDLVAQIRAAKTSIRKGEEVIRTWKAAVDQILELIYS